MKLGDIKKSLAKFPADMDSAEVIIVTVTPAGRQYEHLCAVGILPIDDTCVISICGGSYIREQVEGGKMPKPEGYENLPPVEGDEWKQG